MISPVGKDQAVVEIGCGTGALLTDLADAVGAGGCVTGIEPQPVLAAAALEKVKELEPRILCFRTVSGGKSLGLRVI